MPDPADDSVLQQLRRLNQGVRLLGVLLALNFLLLAALAVAALIFRTGPPLPATPAAGPETAALSAPADDTEGMGDVLPVVPGWNAEEGFQDWPLERKVREASAIFLTRNEQRGERWVGVVEEVLLRRDGVDLTQKPGEVYFPDVARYFPPDAEISAPSGMVVFCMGTPAEMTFVASYSDADRIDGLDDLSFDQFQELIDRFK
ncbi:MAG: hypothetical protein AAGK14_09650 [Verrucomicrobiota bacterium]